MKAPARTEPFETKYRFSVWPGIDQVADWTDIQGSGADTISHTVTGLTNGTTYTANLVAVAGDLA